MGVARGEELDDVGGHVHAAGGVDARRKAEGDIVAGELFAGGVERRGSEERAQTGARGASQLAQAERGDGAVFTAEGNGVGDGGDGRHLEKTGQRFFAAASRVAALKHRLRQLERDGRAAERFFRIRAAGLIGVQDGERGGNRVVQLRARWWSVTMRSRPSLRAVSASAKARMPVSTVMTRRTPSAWAASSTLDCMP